ncbi:unnamed protein product, partial [Aphanomyces euteiches]
MDVALACPLEKATLAKANCLEHLYQPYDFVFTWVHSQKSPRYFLTVHRHGLTRNDKTKSDMFHFPLSP